MKRWISSMILGAALIAPVAMRADDHPKRYYDTDRKDYHEWNDGETKAYRKYLEERHEHYKDWEHASKAQQRAYWKWRHDHPDSMLFPEHH